MQHIALYKPPYIFAASGLPRGEASASRHTSLDTSQCYNWTFRKYDGACFTYLLGTDADWATGDTIIMDENGDRQSDFWLWNLGSGSVYIPALTIVFDISSNGKITNVRLSKLLAYFLNK